MNFSQNGLYFILKLNAGYSVEMPEYPRNGVFSSNSAISSDDIAGTRGAHSFVHNATAFFLAVRFIW